MPVQLVRRRRAPARKSTAAGALCARSRRGGTADTNAHAHPEDSTPRSRLLKPGIPGSPRDALAKVLFLQECLGGGAPHAAFQERQRSTSKVGQYQSIQRV